MRKVALNISIGLLSLTGVAVPCLIPSAGDAQAAEASANEALRLARKLGLNRLEAVVFLSRGARLRDRALVQRAVDLAGDELQRQQAERVLRELE